MDYAFSLLVKYFTYLINNNIPITIDHMSRVNASLRPSGASYRDRLLCGEHEHNPSEIIDELLKDNQGFLIFQEDVTKFLQQICGMNGSRADNVRRAIGRKQLDRLQGALPEILEGYCRVSDKPREVAEEEAKQFLKIIEDASNYMFGYNHSTGYSMVGYLCAYFRYYYPVEFCTGLLNCSKTPTDIYDATMLAKNKNCTIEMPVFRKSGSEFTCDSKNKIIYKGIGSIKDVGKNCGDNLYSLKDNVYDSFVDLLFDIKSNSLADKTEILILIKIDFFKEFGDINYLLSILPIYEKLCKRKTINKSELQQYNLTEDDVRPYSEKEKDKQFSGVDIISIIKIIHSRIIYEKSTLLQRISYDISLIGYTNHIDKNIDENIKILEKIDINKYGTPFFTLYNPSDGSSTSYKVDRKWYQVYPLIDTPKESNIGSILRCAFKTKPKKIILLDSEGNEVLKPNGQKTWVNSGEFEEILTVYKVEK